MFKNSSASYYKKNKERLLKKARERYQDLSEEEKNKSRECCSNINNIKISQKMREIVSGYPALKLCAYIVIFTVILMLK